MSSRFLGFVFFVVVLDTILDKKSSAIKGVTSSSPSSPPILVLPMGPSWDSFPAGLCGPGRGGVWQGAWPGGSNNVTVTIPRASPTSPEMYGNAVTCKHGFRLHAFRAVCSTSLIGPSPSLFRNVILAREKGNSLNGELKSDITGYSYYNESWKDGMAFFDIDTILESRFSHWVSESAVFISYWSDLSEMHPGRLRLVLTNKYKYKVELLSLLGISTSDIIFGGLPIEAALPSSIVYFPPLFSLHDQKKPDLILWSSLWSHLMDRLRASVGAETEAPFYSSGLVILPRSRSGNNQANDRTVPALDWIADNTDKNSATQVRVVAGAKSIIYNYGSAYFVNGGLNRNATIFTIDNEGIGLEQIRDFPAVGMLNAYILSKNQNVHHHYTLSITDDSNQVLQHALSLA